jgi:hypothetical protein
MPAQPVDHVFYTPRSRHLFRVAVGVDHERQRRENNRRTFSSTRVQVSQPASHSYYNEKMQFSVMSMRKALQPRRLPLDPHRYLHLVGESTGRWSVTDHVRAVNSKGDGRCA